MRDSAIMCDVVIRPYDEEIKTIPTNSNEWNITCKAQNYFTFLFLIIIGLLIGVSIYYYLIK